MTVIAWRDGIFAADGMEWWGYTKVLNSKKLHIVNNHIVGYAGDAGAGEKFIRYFQEGLLGKTDPQKEPDFKYEEFTAITAGPDGVVWAWDKNVNRFPVHLPFFAIGIGQDFALAAMECGKSALQAVQIACKWSAGCGGKITVLSLADLKAKKIRKRTK